MFTSQCTVRNQRLEEQQVPRCTLADEPGDFVRQLSSRVGHDPAYTSGDLGINTLMNSGSKDVLKWPLVVAAIVIVVRVILERAGAPENVTNLFSAVALHLLIVPLYFAIRIGISGMPRPYLMQLKLVTLFVVLTRAMIIPIYWLAHILDWQQQRFGGLAPGVSPFIAYFAIPFGTAGFWIAASIVVGTALGSVVIALMSRVYKSQRQS